eukprot:m.195082 g.195082  ORF g.195082 m.195082 type:complete len:177 (-) comp19380_c0_seq1:144-674(-)
MSAVRSSAGPASGTATPAILPLFDMLLNKLSNEVLIVILTHVGHNSGACLVAVAQLSAAWSALGEEAFRALCAQRRWRLPRIPRGDSARSLRPWRTLFLSHCCRSCHGIGEYPLLEYTSKQQMGLLCGQCAGKPFVIDVMIRKAYNLQTVSIEGREMRLHKPKKSRKKQHPKRALR